MDSQRQILAREMRIWIRGIREIDSFPLLGRMTERREREREREREN